MGYGIQRQEGLEGITRKISQLGLIPTHPDYTTIWYRIHALIPDLSPPGFTETEIATDGSGLKTRNAGEYRTFKYGDREAKQKKHLVVVITADVRIEGKGYTEASIAMEHLSYIYEKGIKIGKFCGEGAFDQGAVFDRLHSLRG